jgi:ribosomal protein L37E
MPLMRCPHCGEDTFTITGLAALDHCASCGRPLGKRRVELNAALKAKQRVAADDKGPVRPGTASQTRNAGRT